MPYPRVFQPNTLCTVGDGFGNTSPNCPVQLFRPFLGCQFNGPQPRILSVDIPQFAGGILRGLVSVPNTPPLTIKPGPHYWKDSKPPALVLSEDPNGLTWVWLDALPWDPPGPVTSKIWSFWAAVGYIPPPPPTPIVMGPNPPAAPLIVPGTQYVANIAALGTGFVYIPKAGGVAYSSTLYSQTQINTTTTLLGGNHAGATFAEGAGLGLGTFPVAGGAHVGPDAILQLTNTQPAIDTVVFSLV